MRSRSPQEIDHNCNYDNQTIRTLLFQRYFPHYRKPIFESLAQDPTIELTLIHGKQDGLGGLVNIPLDKTRIQRCVGPTRKIGPAILGLWTMPHMVKCARLADYDAIIIMSDLHCLSIWPAWNAARKRGKAVLLFGIGFAQRPKLLRDQLRVRLAHRCDAMILYSYEHRHRFIDKGVPSEKLFVAPNAIDTVAIESAESDMTQEILEQFKVQKGLKGIPTVIHAGRMVEYKRLDLLLHAVVKLSKDGHDFKVILIGDGPMLKPWKNLSESLGLKDRVIWPGAIYDQKELCYWFHSSQICVAPGQQGLIANLCHAYGLPLITSDNSRLQGPEIQVFTNGKTGLLYRYGDVDDLADRIKELHKNSELRQKMAKTARRRVFVEFTMDKMCKGFVDAICYAMNKQLG